jgi:hypothetical protein
MGCRIVDMCRLTDMLISRIVGVPSVKIAGSHPPWRCSVLRTSGPQPFAFGGGARFCLVRCQARDDTGVALVVPAERHTGQVLLSTAVISA